MGSEEERRVPGKTMLVHEGTINKQIIIEAPATSGKEVVLNLSNQIWSRSGHIVHTIESTEINQVETQMLSKTSRNLFFFCKKA